jgi:hypothetical protein
VLHRAEWHLSVRDRGNGLCGVLLLSFVRLLGPSGSVRGSEEGGAAGYGNAGHGVRARREEKAEGLDLGRLTYTHARYPAFRLEAACARSFRPTAAALASPPLFPFRLEPSCRRALDAHEAHARVESERKPSS